MEEEEITIDDIFNNNLSIQTSVDSLEEEDQAVDSNAVDYLEEEKPLATETLPEVVISSKPEIAETAIGSSEILDDVPMPSFKYSDLVEVTNEADRLIDVAKKAGYSDIPEKEDLINAIRSKDRGYLRDLKKNINTDIRITNAANDLYRSELYNEEEEKLNAYNFNEEELKSIEKAGISQDINFDVANLSEDLSSKINTLTQASLSDELSKKEKEALNKKISELKKIQPKYDRTRIDISEQSVPFSKKVLDTVLGFGATVADITSGAIRSASFTDKIIAKTLFPEKLKEIEKKYAGDADEEAKQISKLLGGGVTELLISNQFGKLKSAFDVLELTGVDTPDIPALAVDVATELDSMSESINEQMFNYERSITESFDSAITSGNWGLAFSTLGRTTSEAIKSLPYMAIASTGSGGLMAIGASVAAGGEHADNTDASKAYIELSELDKSDPDYESKKEALEQRIRDGEISYKNLAHHTFNGLVNSQLERFSGAMGKKLFSSLSGRSKEVIDSSLKTYFLTFIKDSGGEGITEGVQTGLEKLSNAVLGRKPEDFNKALLEIYDSIIIGTVSGGGISGATTTSNMYQSAVKTKKQKDFVKEAGVDNVVQLVDGDVNIQQIEAARQGISLDSALNKELDIEISNGDVTVEKANEIKERNIKVAGLVNQIKPLNLSNESQVDVVNLLLKKQELTNEIKDLDSAMTQTQSQEINEINQQLQDIVQEDKTKVIEKGSEVIAGQLDVGIESFDTTEDTAGAIETLKNQGGKVDIKNSTDYGTIVEIPNDQGGIDTQIIINKEEAAADNVVTTSQHEVLHAVLSKTTKGNPETTIALGKSLLNELRGDGVNLGGDFEARLDQYVKDPNISEADVMEEVMTLASEGLTNGEITINESTLTKIGNAIKKFFGLNNINIRFNTGKDVLNFIRDYNKSVQKGEGLTKSQLEVATEGAKGKLIDNAKTEIETIVTKQSKSPQGEQASIKVQEIYDAKGKDGAFEIIEQFDPIVSRIVEKRSEAPNFDRQLLTDEINTGKRGIIDLIAEYKPESNVPLAAYINKFLPARAIEASQRVLGKEFTTDVTEAKAVVAEETKQPEVVSRKVKKPSETKAFDKDIENKIDEAITKIFKDKDVKFSETRNIPKEVADIYAEELGINPETIVDKRRNYSKKDAEGLTKAKQLLLKNAKDDYARLPKLRDDFGKGTFVPKNVKDALYTDGKLTGTLKDYMDLIREKPVKPIYRDRVGQTIRGLLNLAIRNRIIEIAQPSQAKRLQQGVKFSKKKEITVDTNKGKEQLEEISQARDINKAMKIIDPSLENKVGVTFENKIEKQEAMQEALKDYKISEEAFLNSKFSNFGRKKVDDVYIDEPAKGSLYFGTKDPAYEKALAQVKANDIKSGKKPKRVNANTAGTSKANIQSDINIDALESVALELETAVKNGMPIELAALFISSGYQATTGLVKISAKFVGESTNPQYAKEGKNNQTKGKYKWREEHSPPASVVGASIIWAIKNGQVKQIFPFIKQNYIQVKLSKADDVKIDRAKLDATLPEGVSILTPNAGIRRFAASGINLNTIKDFKTGKTFADIMNVGVTNKASEKNPNIIYAQNALISEQITDNLDGKTTQARIKAYEPIADLEFKASKKNTIKFGDKVNNEMTVADQLTMLGVYDKAASVGRKLDTPKKGISVFDFDDTLAKTKEKVIVNNPDGTTIEITAAKFAEQASELEAEGATFDFSNFDNVVNAKKGPLADLALKRQDKFGSKDIFVLTARPQIAAEGIKKFLDGIGLNIPLANITGLENGTPGAKGNWVAGKAAEGYNDFYFADDAYKNVQAVQEVLSQIDVNSVVQIAKSSKKITFDKIFNDILESSTGIESYKEYSAARAKTVGANKGKFTFFNTPSAEDFTGLLYKTLGKGKVGDAQMAFYKTNLLDPYNRAELAVTKTKITAANDFKALKSNLKTLPKSLSKQTGIGGFTFSQASRVAAWTRQNMEIPGLSKRDIKELNDFVDNNAELNTFVDELIKIQKGKPYPKPGKNWLGGTITSDILNEINKVNRKAYLQEWQENVDIIFSDKNMNKLEAAYGPNYVEALRDQLARMKSGSNRPIGGSRVVNNVLDWLNNSVGAVMFLNTRSAVLQTLSSVNFINFGNNNIYKAGKAFANQPQFWKDFKTLMNSPYLVERRNGLKINVSESEIADAVAEASNKPKAAISYLLNKGFIFTRIADSFAIASGGATFYRNQLDAYVKDGMDVKEAEKRAFDDFYAIAEENQQSSNPSKISQQQASGAGRVILAFANTPMQYARIIKRSSQDLINKRGDWKSNVSKIVYYAAIQNIAFNALQNALFSIAFNEDEEEEKEDKTGRIANGMADSLLRGLGIQGAAVSALKNSLLTIANENDKESPKFVKAVYDLFDFSPPIDSKFRKLRSGANTVTWERENIKNKGFDLDNPAYLAGAQVISGLTNIPLDRAIQKINNIRAITSNSSQNWQKVAMALGWSTWDVGLPYYGVDDKVEMTPQMILKEKVTVMKKETNTKQQKEMLLKLGLTKQQIKDLKYEEARVKKIIELQEKTNNK